MMSLKHRIIPVILYDGMSVIKPVQFKHPARRVGTLMQAIQVYETRKIDELIIINIMATPTGEQYFTQIKDYTEQCYMPVTLGGGIKTLDDIKLALDHGADKVSIQDAILHDKKLIYNAANKFGSQCIVVSVDCMFKEKYIRSFTENFIYPVADWCKYLEAEGAGEILLTSVKHDGLMQGYDREMIRAVTEKVKIPVIANGGCGEPHHMLEALEAGAHAVAASSMFLYTEYTPKDCAKYLDANGWNVRLR